MIKKLLMAAAVVVMAVPAAAQGSRRSEVSVSYGVAPVTDWIDSYSDMLTGLFTNANTDLKGWGAVTVGYSFRLIGSLRLGDPQVVIPQIGRNSGLIVISEIPPGLTHVRPFGKTLSPPQVVLRDGVKLKQIQCQ